VKGRIDDKPNQTCPPIRSGWRGGMNRVAGKVAFITGAARGQGRSHAVRLAEEGADIIAVDLCADLPELPYKLGTPEDLQETVARVEQLDRRIVAVQADVRDQTQIDNAVARGMDTFARIDIVVANAGICGFGPVWELSEQSWQQMLDVNLSGVWRTVKATVPHLIERGQGGSIVLTSSLAGLAAYVNTGHYTASKHGVTGLMRALAAELAPHQIRVNSVHPTTVNTPMVNNDATYEVFAGRVSLGDGARDAAIAAMTAMNGFAVPWVEPIDISNAVLYLASDESRYVSGATHVIDTNAMAPFRLRHG
jgi:SDR family mycofactocin-dependent oxidoreductase